MVESGDQSRRMVYRRMQAATLHQTGEENDVRPSIPIIRHSDFTAEESI